MPKIRNMQRTPLGTIHNAIVDYYKVNHLDIFIKNRKRETIHLRQIFHYLARHLNSHFTSQTKIGNYYSEISGNTWNHATVIYSCKTIQGYMDVDRKFKEEIEQIIKLIQDNE